jgi:hypothetical protein
MTTTQEPTALRMQLVDVMNHELRTPSTTLLGHCDLAALGRAVVSEQMSQAAARGITFRMSRFGPHAVAFADEKLVREAVAALVAHAVERASTAFADAAPSAGSVVEVSVDVYEDIAALSVRTSDSDGRFPKAPAMVPFTHLAVPVPRSGDDVAALVLAGAVAAAHGGFLLVSAGDEAPRCLRLELPRGLRLAA